jgi:hypothetical protein
MPASSRVPGRPSSSPIRHRHPVAPPVGDGFHAVPRLGAEGLGTGGAVRLDPVAALEADEESHIEMRGGRSSRFRWSRRTAADGCGPSGVRDAQAVDASSKSLGRRTHRLLRRSLPRRVVTRTTNESHHLRSWPPLSGPRTWLQPDEAVDLIDQAIDLGPVVAPSLVVIARMPHVHRGGDEHGATGDKLVELFGVHRSRPTNTRSHRGWCAALATDRGTHDPQSVLSRIGVLRERRDTASARSAGHGM